MISVPALLATPRESLLPPSHREKYGSIPDRTRTKPHIPPPPQSAAQNRISSVSRNSSTRWRPGKCSPVIPAPLRIISGKVYRAFRRGSNRGNENHPPPHNSG